MPYCEKCGNNNNQLRQSGGGIFSSGKMLCPSCRGQPSASDDKGFKANMKGATKPPKHK